MENTIIGWGCFIALGYNEGKFYYKDWSGYIRGLKATQHSINNLLALAPLEYWEVSFPSKRSVDWLSAKNALMRECCRKGIYTPENK